MLRRKPTPITLTADDISAYDDHRVRTLQTAHHPNHRPENTNPLHRGKRDHDDGHKPDPNDELKPLPGDRPRIRGAAGGGGGATGVGSSAASGLGREREERILGR